MTKDELQRLSAEVERVHGPAIWDMGEPQNESARQLVQIRREYRSTQALERHQKRKEAGYKMAPEGLAEIANTVRQVRAVADIPALFLNDKDLTYFTPIEKEILKSHFTNMRLSNAQLGKIHNVSYQLVTELLTHTAVLILYGKVFGHLLPLKTWQSLLKAVDSGDKAVTLRLAEHFGLISNPQLDVNTKTKPIDDPEALKLLKDLGDKLA